MSTSPQGSVVPRRTSGGGCLRTIVVLLVLGVALAFLYQPITHWVRGEFNFGDYAGGIITESGGLTLTLLLGALLIGAIAVLALTKGDRQVGFGVVRRWSPWP